MANANNGNWQTASRWARFLEPDCRVSLLPAWQGEACDALIALHARRSAPSIFEFASACPTLPLVTVLTGTDLYRDILDDDDAKRSLALSTRLVVLQEDGLRRLDPLLRGKTTVIYQSAPALPPIEASERSREVIMIGHLREEKCPQTFMQAAERVTAPGVAMIHVGGALEPELGKRAEATARRLPHYRWLGNLPHDQTRERLRRSLAMAIASRMEGGANVIIEAVTSGVPVLASDIPGNRGMLGDGYAGYFPPGDSAALARLIDRVAADDAFLALLRAQCAARAGLFAPERERAALRQLLDNLIFPDPAR
ncbi:putative glycosyltransferase, TIGR04348 family [Noviherbaspirillum humi]|uniref:Putative glycosyltransferase, TIGR04348 family n=2 Tax=Noviherbaspirillum humi TaxID=1688639 RepID=A0A239L0Q3_9BURK|nr:putative glycosyltransferase, TIGR04348 family [Noviherbaspirillum humi]